MDFDEVVIEHKEVNGVAQVFNFLAVTERETSEAAIEKPVGQVGAFDKRG